MTPLKLQEPTFKGQIWYLMTVIALVSAVTTFGFCFFTEKDNQSNWLTLSHFVFKKEINSQTDWYLFNLSSKTYVFEDKMTKF